MFGDHIVAYDKVIYSVYGTQENIHITDTDLFPPE